MEFTAKIDLTKKPAKSLLKSSSITEKTSKKKNSVVWDTKNLEENAEYLRLHPPTMRIEEPKTPYDPYEQGDDLYLEKVRQMFNVKATEDVLNDVSNELFKHFDEKGEIKKDNEMVEIEVYEDGKLVKKKVSKNHRDNIEFLKKRRVAYGNEYTNAKKLVENEEEENNNKNKKKKELTEEELKEIELDDQTVKNTIINKFSSLVFKKKKEEELAKLKEGKQDEDKKEELKEKANEETKKKKEKKKIVFMEKTEEIPNIEFPGEAEFNKEEKNENK